MRTISAVAVGVLLAAGRAAADQPINLDQLAPSISQLGAGWPQNPSVPKIGRWRLIGTGHKR